MKADKIFKNIKILVFDVGNTLVQSSTSIKDTIFNSIRRSDRAIDLVQFDSEFKACTEDFFKNAYKRKYVTIKELHIQRLKSLYERYNLSLSAQDGLNQIYKALNSCKLYTDASILLNELKTKYRSALLSNADEDDPAIKILLNEGYYFDPIITSESVRAYKPSPVIFRELINRLQLDKDEILYIGNDLFYDVNGGKDFGLKVIWVNRKNEIIPKDNIKPDLIINNLTELIDVLQI